MCFDSMDTDALLSFLSSEKSHKKFSNLFMKFGFIYLERNLIITTEKSTDKTSKISVTRAVTKHKLRPFDV